MDFHQLLARMQELDRPATESQPVQADECGMMPPSSPPPMPSEPPIPHPSLSFNLNAQGMDNIEQIMRLITKVNPDAVPQQPPMPAMVPPPSIMSIKPELPPLKMLPDFDADNDDMPGGEKDMNQPGDLGASLDRDGDGDHDMDDHDLEKRKLSIEPIDRDGEEDGELDNDREKEELGGAVAGGALGAAVGGPLGALTGAAAGDSLTDPDADEVEKKEAWDNEPDECEANVDYMNNKLAGGMNRPKGTYPKVAGGDNPMQRVREASDLKDQIKAELRRRLAEAKGAR